MRSVTPSWDGCARANSDHFRHINVHTTARQRPTVSLAAATAIVSPHAFTVPVVLYHRMLAGRAVAFSCAHKESVKGMQMAKKRTEEERGGKMTFVMFQMEGDDHTLQEGLRAITKAIAGIHPTVQVVQQQVVPPTGAPTGLPDAAIDVRDYEEVNEPEQPAPAAQRQGAAARKAPRPAKVLGELDLTSGEMPLKRFFDEHPVEGIYKRYVWIAYWFKNYRDTPGITSDHVHTCFKIMGWTTPARPMQPLTDMVHKNQWFRRENGVFFINHVGENQFIEAKGGA